MAAAAPLLPWASAACSETKLGKIETER